MPRGSGPATLLALAAFAPSAAPGDARAELTFDLGGRIQSDVRFRIERLETGGFYDRRALPAGVDRNENFLKLLITSGVERFRGVADVDVVFIGSPDSLEDISDLSERRRIEPFRIEAHSLYLEADDLFIDDLHLRVGNQIVSWGAGDQFNPTNNLNADDLEDPLLFGTQQANLMARLDYSPFDGAFTVSAVAVPLFRPALVPPSAELAVAAVDRLPHLDPSLRQRIYVETAIAAGALAEGLGVGGKFPTIVGAARPALPEASFKNIQFGAQLSTAIAEQDIALSYYRGFFDIPQAVQNITNQETGKRCNPDDATDCVDGLLRTEVTLTYPRIQVIGLNVAGEWNVFGWISEDVAPLGYRLELGVFFPEEQRLTMRQGEITIGGMTRPAGEYAYPGGEAPLVMDDRVFAKWVLGLDYTFSEHFYVNLQWVHGLVDEFGAGDFLGDGVQVRQGGVSTPASDTVSCLINMAYGQCAREITRPKLADYFVAGLDIHFSGADGLLRLFTVFDLSGYTETFYSNIADDRVSTKHSPFSEEGFSAILYPELNYNFGGGFELGAGALLQLGKRYTKFGDPATGGSLVWTRGRYSF